VVNGLQALQLEAQASDLQKEEQQVAVASW